VSTLQFKMGCCFSEMSPDSKAVPVENVNKNNNFLNEVKEWAMAQGSYSFF
jgi:hypothetical protein